MTCRQNAPLDTHRDMEMMLKGYGVTTAKIYYRMPDHRNLIQLFVWQLYDIAPKFPELTRFLDFWRTSLDGPIHSVAYVHERLIRPNEWRSVTGEFRLH